MKWLYFFFGVLSIVALACGPAGAARKDVRLAVTTFVDEDGMGTFPETYQPLPNTLVVAKWNQHGHMLREVKLTDQNGQADFSVSYTHFFDVSVIPPCGYYSTSSLFRDVTNTEKTEFGFWPAEPGNRSSRVMVLLWKDMNSNAQPDPGEGIRGEKATLMFKTPGGNDGNAYDEDNFIKEAQDGRLEFDLGNSCGTVYMFLLNSELTTNSVSEPGMLSDAGNHGNTFYPSIEIPYEPGDTAIYWELK